MSFWHAFLQTSFFFNNLDLLANCLHLSRRWNNYQISSVLWLLFSTNCLFSTQSDSWHSVDEWIEQTILFKVGRNPVSRHERAVIEGVISLYRLSSPRVRQTKTSREWKSRRRLQGTRGGWRQMEKASVVCCSGFKILSLMENHPCF